MSALLRSRLAARATPVMRPVVYPRGRFFAHSSYGGEGETDPQQPNNPRNTPTRDIEHPGPPPPDTSSSTPANDKGRQEPSNKARPTLGDEDKYVDRDGKTTKDAPQDVKQHNEELSKRYDHPQEHA
ncbi:uncharacterized protein BO80DRAFT_435748 [Aspergillus ibericus CBS 121593]|uniref:Uncharacterized protein n=1 Tax=Aspergillus ibericus CBS 121593 TaxID=1448316 RepID=A0A395GYJ9_9EURO|nr:hypothetical protein BO80DRAFT_435748 [Aspergillus ibericus CBS 121593]RAK99757.1 hypothetical protein BO80DRAFT_435748 [Aspergillus ibericus CBS 121593]